MLVLLIARWGVLLYGLLACPCINNKARTVICFSVVQDSDLKKITEHGRIF